MLRTVKLMTSEELVQVRQHIEARAAEPPPLLHVSGGGYTSLADASITWAEGRDPRFYDSRGRKRGRKRRDRSRLQRDQQRARDAGTDDRVQL